MYRKRRKPGNHGIDDAVKNEAVRLLKEEQWSPVQISGYLSKQEKHISHETIYRIIRKDKRDGGSLYKNCRHRLKHRTRPVGGKRISIPNRTSISERPAEADGKRFGDFEMDTIVGNDGHGAIVTLTERSTNMLFMRKLNKGKYTGCWECHLEPDWLLIWRQNDYALELILVDTGTHSDLF